MSNPMIQVIKLKVRRGTDAQRKTIKLDQGELGFTTDTQRLFVGNGVDFGGVSVSTKVFTPISNNYNDLTTVNAQIGDIATVGSVSYQLTGADYTNLQNWVMFSPQLDSQYLQYTNGTTGVITLKSQSISALSLHTQSLSSNTINFNSNKLNVNYNTTLFNETSGTLSISDNSLSARHISSQTVGAGLSGGNGVPLFVDIDNNTIQLVGNKLTVTATPLTALRYEDLDLGFDTSLWNTERKLRTTIASADPNTFTVGASGQLFLQSPPLSAVDAVEMPFISVDRGYVAGISSAIFDILSADDSFDSTFNGAPNQVTTPYTPIFGNTSIEAISAGNTIILTSGGFIVFEGGRPTRNNSSHIPNRFAIPVFTLP